MNISQYCKICNPKNKTIYWHSSKEGGIWCWCNKCNRAYTIEQYCQYSGISLKELLSSGLDISDDADNEVRVMTWPSHFITLTDSRAEKGREYLRSRGLSIDGDMYYDVDEEGIVFPYYYKDQFCGAQVRFIKERVNSAGDKWKITTLPGTRLGVLIYGWSQAPFLANVKAVVVTEGAFNAISINQALNTTYGGIANNPWRAVACSGSGASKHQREIFKELVEAGYRVVIAPDTDEAGLNMLKKYIDEKALTHYALTDERDVDWNDKLKELGHQNFAKFFMSKIKSL